MLQIYPDEDLTFLKSNDLDSYNFSVDDNVKDVFIKYFQRHSASQAGANEFIIPDSERERVFSQVLKFDQEPPLFAQAIVTL